MLDKLLRQSILNSFSANTMEESTTASSSGSYVTPQVWAKDLSNWKAYSDPSFPQYGGDGGKFVRVKDSCKTFPYCNQGDINSLDLFDKPRRKKKKSKKRTPLERRKSKIAKNLVRTQKIKTPRGSHYNIGKWISEDGRYLYNNKLTLDDINRVILERTEDKKETKNMGKTLEDIIKKNLREDQLPQGYKIYKKSHEASGKSNVEGLKLAAEKIKSFMKDDDGETIEPKMYRNTTAQDEYVEEVNYGSGMTGLEYDQPLTDEQKERHEKYLKGSSETGNAVTGKGLEKSAGMETNVMTKNSEGGSNSAGEMLSNAAKRRMQNKEKAVMNNDRRYTPDSVKESELPELVVNEYVIDTEKQIMELTPSEYLVNGNVYTITNGDETKKVRYESFIGRVGGQVIIMETNRLDRVNESIDRMRTLMGHNSNTRHNKFL
tara:strand:- start:18390 stop:19688 length:1299 start_codon:yes stop_codon:yes gene_type:complete